MSVFHMRDLGREYKGKYIAVDSNILIQLCDTNHQFHRTTADAVERCVNQVGVQMVYFVATKLELQDYFRRSYLTRSLRERVRSGQRVGGKGNLDRLIFGEMAALQPGSKADYILSDKDIKWLRTACFDDYDDSKDGIRQWQQICKLALGHTLTKLETVLSRAKIQYKSARDPEFFSQTKPPEWADQNSLMVSWGLGSSDAAIFNMALTSPAIQGICTNDRDIVALCESAEFGGKFKCFTLLPEHFHKKIA